MMKGTKLVYICSECEYESPKWMGKCPHCGAWNSFVEDVVVKETTAASAPKRTSMLSAGENEVSHFSNLEAPDYIRTATELSELDRVLGGGLVCGSVVLLSGEPGIGNRLCCCRSVTFSERIRRSFTYRERNQEVRYVCAPKG